MCRLEIGERNQDHIAVQAGNNKVVLTAEPLKLEFYQGDILVSVVNGKGLFAFEHYRTKPAEG